MVRRDTVSCNTVWGVGVIRVITVSTVLYVAIRYSLIGMVSKMRYGTLHVRLVRCDMVRLYAVIR